MSDQDALLSIGRLAEITALTVPALRPHDRLGGLVPTAVDYASGYRYDAEAQVEDRWREGQRILRRRSSARRGVVNQDRCRTPGHQPR